jgi:enediyne biosynthesis protein E4
MSKFLTFLFALVIISCSRSTRFRIVSLRETGIDFENKITETDSLNAANYEYIFNGAGVGVGDLNNDGLPDIILVGNQVSPKVYLNLGNFKFRDITGNFAGMSNNQWYSGVAIADINSDGWPDVYLTATASKDPEKRKNRLWVSSGSVNGKDPVFTEMAERYGIADGGWSVSAAFFDYDRDGYLDLYVLNNTLNRRMDALYRPKVIDGSAANNDRLYHNNRDGTFTDVTIPAGIVYEGFGLGLAIGDVNKDGYPDIYISNDFVSNDLLYINQGDGTFRNEIRKYISYQSRASMGNDMSDVNNDGNPDIFTLDMQPDTYYKRKQTNSGNSYLYYLYDAKFGYEHQYVRNMLHLHNGFVNNEMLPYSEVGQMMGIYQTNWSWSPLFADYDNDGDKDLIITAGYPIDLTDKDWTRYKENVTGFLSSEKDAIKKAPVLKIPNEAFDNTGELNFINRSAEWLPQIPSFSNGAAFADLDNDGDLDFVVNNINDKPFILRNSTIESSKNNSNFIKIILVGKPGNTMAIGAKTELWIKGTCQYYEHFLTRGYASSVDPVIHFGLGTYTSVDSIKVTWPASGYATVAKNVKANQIIDLKEVNSQPSGTAVKSHKINDLLFSKADNYIDYIHEQTDFADFFLNQKIIPHKFSQIGPAMAKGDIDGDGREDLIIGSTNKLPTSVFLRKGNGFEKAEYAGLTNKKEFSEADLAIVDINNDGHRDIVSVAGGYENPLESDYIHYLYEYQNGSFTRIDLPIPPFPASVIRPCDFNHDGYNDLFIGSRIKKGQFPFADNSWIVINDNGKLKTDPWCSFDLGMVTDAVWSDYDNDGWEDLIIAREWNSVLILKNMQGKCLVQQEISEMEAHRGIWNSIIAGDFDKNGYEDYIVGNLGENNRFTISDKYPLNLYAIDLDRDGNLDPLMTGYWRDQNGNMKEFPVNYLDDLVGQSAFFKNKFNSYASFSYAAIDDILNKNILKKLELKLNVNTASSYVIWNIKGKMKWDKLPLELQVAPIKKMIVCDFNDDSYPDVLCAGNDYTYDVSTGDYDANKGIVLLSNGKNQSFNVLPRSQSGLVLQGMVESLLYLKGDTSLIVAGINRTKAVVFRQNKKHKKSDEQIIYNPDAKY